MLNKKMVLAKRPNGLLEQTDFQIIDGAVPELHDGEVLVRTLFLSVDPYMRERMSPSTSYMKDFGIGETIEGTLIGQIEESRNPDFAAGDIVTGFLGWQVYNKSDGAALRKIPNRDVPPETALTTLGSPGLTGYFGLLEHGQPKEKETVVVSGAAGAVGTVVGQIAKIRGCRVVGISGSDEKNEYLVKELGFDAAINYKTEENLEEALKAACPNGIDIYYDNVGNDWINFITKMINKNARLILCGQISQYNGASFEIDSKIFGRLTKSSATIKGFMITDYNRQQSDDARAVLAQWITEGKILNKETIEIGIENAPQALISIFTGKNIGKQLVKVSDVQ